MSSVIHAAAVYLLFWVSLRIAGRRTLSQMTNFDLILLLFISESAQTSMMGSDNSLTNTLLVIATLIGINVVISLIQRRWPALGRYFDGLPLVIVADGQPFSARMHMARVDESAVLAAARNGPGLERMDQIQYAVLERNGVISVIPKKNSERSNPSGPSSIDYPGS